MSVTSDAAAAEIFVPRSRGTPQPPLLASLAPGDDPDVIPASQAPEQMQQFSYGNQITVLNADGVRALGCAACAWTLRALR